ncbi:MAG TPA: DUF4129 domain-containing protein, partial [Ktedonobacteraceae bacterium]|nr:DUF4129 domain-containing protein [Ktedonobacteraceae bacterium]
DLLVGIVLLAVLPVSLLFYIWLHFYAQQFALFDAGWLVTLIHDMSQPEVDFQLLLVGILLSVSGWLSGHMSEQQVNAALLLRKGSLLMSVLAALDLGEGLLQGRPDFWQAAMLFTTFFWLGLLAQSLQKASAKRRNHPMERSELAIRQERIIFQMMACLGLVVAGTDVAMIVIHGGLSIPFPRLNLFDSPPLEPTPLPSFSSQTQHLPVSRVIPLPSLSLSGSLWESVTALFVLLCIASLYFALRFWQKYRQRTKGKLVEQVERTSLWSLALFLAQCKSLLLALLAFLHLLPRSIERVALIADDDLHLAALEARTVREISRAFLSRATQQGYLRAIDETPYEFRLRLHERELLLEPELGAITEAYMLVRYGGSVPHSDDLARAKEIWSKLERKWPAAARASL